MEHTSPPTTPFVCVIGVTGHRDLAPEAILAITQAVSDILDAIRQQIASQLADAPERLFSSRAPVLRCVSPLAEGADQIVARQALEQGYDLQAPLPFPVAEYEEDFKKDGSLTEFRELHARASAVLELDGTRAAQDDAYLAVGRVVLEQSDLLLAVWDGAVAKGRGGTGQIVAEAQNRGIPVLVVTPSDPVAIRFLSPCATGNWEQDLKTCIRRVLLPPAAPADSPSVADKPASSRLRSLSEFLLGGPPAGTSPQQYFAETWKHPSFPNTILGAFPSWFEKILAFHRPKAVSQTGAHSRHVERLECAWNCSVSLFSQGSDSQSPSTRTTYPWCDALGLESQQSQRTEDILAEHYAWADHLALYYGVRFSGGNSIMAMVILGLFVGSYLEGLKGLGFSIQFLAFVVIITLVRLNHRRDWHQRFLDYRYLAEHLRHMRYLAFLGRAPAFAHDGEDPGCDKAGWPAWLLRNISRRAGLVDAVISPGMLTAYRNRIKNEVIDDQAAFYRDRQQRYETIAGRLEDFGLACFIGGLLFIFLRAAVFIFAGEETSLPFGVKGLQLCTLVNEIVLVIPAVASMAFALRSQGEYPRLATRYGRTLELLARQREVLEKIIPVTSATLGDFAEELAHVLSSEVFGWHMLVKNKGLSPY